MSILNITYANKALPDGSVFIENSQGETVTSNNPKILFDYLAKNYTENINKKLFWDIDNLLAPIFKLLGLGVCTELVKEPDNEALIEFTDNGILIHDYKNKYEDGSKEIRQGYYSIYYHRKTSFGLQVHGLRKSYFNGLSEFHENTDGLDVTDLKQILVKSDEVVKAFNQMGLNPFKMASPISVFEDSVLKNIDFPTLADIPMTLSEDDCNEMATWAEKIMHRVWTMNHAVGCWNDGETTDYDLSSAYGYFFSELYDYRYATFTKSTTPIKEAGFGMLKGKVTIYPNVKCSPISYKINGRPIYPINSTWDDILTLPEIRLLYRYKLGEFKMEYGYFWKQDKPVQPFKQAMQRIYNERAKGGLIKKLAKRIGASAWAKLIEKPTSINGNPYYSPLLALQVKTNCRVAVAEFIHSNKLQDNVIHIGTDGVRTNKQIELPKQNGMGSWIIKGQDKCIVLSPGLVYTPTHKPSGLYYDDIIRMINENPEETYYNTTRRRPITLSEAVEINELDSVGVIADLDTSVDVMNACIEQGMDYDDFPTCGRELLENKYYGKSPILEEVLKENEVIE